MVQSLDSARAQEYGGADARRAGSNRIPPHNLEAEESLLGAMMLSREALTAAVEAHIEAHDFYKPAHGIMFDAAAGYGGTTKSPRAASGTVYAPFPRLSSPHIPM